MKINVDPREIAKFDGLASEWWDPTGPMRALHLIHPVRLAYIHQHVIVRGKYVLDVGCGGGLLTESLAQAGADHILGIDLSESLLHIARNHARDNPHITSESIDYQCVDVETLAQQQPGTCDVVLCMEMLEHVPAPERIVAACAQLLKPGGSVFFSTINRHPKAFLFGIVGAEYIFHFLPRGTHTYADFIRPSELDQWAQASDLRLHNISGMTYDVFSKKFALSHDVRINYLTCYGRE